MRPLPPEPGDPRRRSPLDPERLPEQRAAPSATPSEHPPTHEVTALEVLWQNVWVRGVVYVVLGVLVLLMLITQQHRYMFALQVAAIGFLIAYILNPLVDLLRRLRINRALAVVLVYLLVLQVFVLGSALLTNVVAETARFVALVPAAIEELAVLLARAFMWLGGIMDAAPGFVQERFGVDLTGDEVAQQSQEQLAAWLTALAQALNRFLERVVAEGPAVLMAGATSIISTTFQMVLIVIGSAYILYDYHRLSASIRRYVPVRWRAVHADISRKADRAIGGYLRGQILISLILGSMIWVGLTLSGVPLALAISFLAAVFNLVPYLGPVVGTVPAVLLGLTVSPLTALLALIVFIVANQVEAHLLSPMILGKSTDIHPVTVLISILIGIGFLGILGAFVAVPVAALIKVVLEEYLLTRPAYQEPPAGPDPPQQAAPVAPPPLGRAGRSAAGREPAPR
jgi:predicted PurR-regulated permease PerM